MTVRTRFTPAPRAICSGQPAHRTVRLPESQERGGTFILRIEDTDQVRQVEGAVDIIYNTPAPDRPSVGRGAPTSAARSAPMCSPSGWGCSGQYAEQLVKAGQAYYASAPPERLEKMRQEQLAKGASATRYDLPLP